MRKIASPTVHVSGIDYFEATSDNFEFKLPANIKSQVICIDPGHGGDRDNGAAWGYSHEDDVNLAISFYLRYELMLAGFNNIIMTRKSDRHVSLRHRCEIARHYKTKNIDLIYLAENNRIVM